MDPNVTLLNARSALADHRDLVDRKEEGREEDDTLELEALRDLADAFEALNGWLDNGGFLPSDWQGPARRSAGEVWVLTLEHRHGVDNTVHRTEEGARNTLHAWVELYWQEEHERNGTGEVPDMPSDRDAAIEAYFDAVDSESYLLGPATVGD